LHQRTLTIELITGEIKFFVTIEWDALHTHTHTVADVTSVKQTDLQKYALRSTNIT
jgi:hypothetical protein